MSAYDAQFLRLLRKDIDYFDRAIECFENLVPRLSAPVQDQWRLQAQSRRDFLLELEILLDKAIQSVNEPGSRGGNNAQPDSASC